MLPVPNHVLFYIMNEQHAPLFQHKSRAWNVEFWEFDQKQGGAQCASAVARAFEGGLSGEDIIRTSLHG